MPLLLDLLRHGLAEPSNPLGDSERGLTPAGRERLTYLAERLGRDGWHPERALSSPYRRARETADLVLAVAGVGIAVETLAELQPDADPGELIAALEDLELASGHLLIVTHQPLVGSLVHHLTEQDRPFGPGDITRIVLPEGPRGSGTLEDI